MHMPRVQMKAILQMKVRLTQEKLLRRHTPIADEQKWQRPQETH